MKRILDELEAEKAHKVENAKMMEQSQFAHKFTSLNDLRNMISNLGVNICNFTK